MKNYAIFCKLFKAITKTGQNIKSELLNTLGEYGIICDNVKKHVVFVADKGANIKKLLNFFIGFHVLAIF